MQEPDAHFSVDVQLSADETQVLLVLGSATANEVRALDAATPQGAFRVVLKRKPGREGDADHRVVAAIALQERAAVNEDDR